MVSKIYSKIAQHFSETRYSHWKLVKEFIVSLPKYSIILDIGCGNGKYTTVRNDLIFMCFDITPELLCIAKDNIKGSKKDFIHTSCINNIPIKNKADYAISIAVIHHLPTYASRFKAISNIIEKVNKSILITLWAFEQTCTKKRDTKWKQINKDNDYLIPWLDKFTNITHMRFYHLFTYDEVYKVCEELKQMYRLLTYSITFEKDNWIIQVNL